MSTCLTCRRVILPFLLLLKAFINGVHGTWSTNWEYIFPMLQQPTVWMYNNNNNTLNVVPQQLLLCTARPVVMWSIISGVLIRAGPLSTPVAYQETRSAEMNAEEEEEERDQKGLAVRSGGVSWISRSVTRSSSPEPLISSASFVLLLPPSWSTLCARFLFIYYDYYYRQVYLPRCSVADSFLFRSSVGINSSANSSFVGAGLCVMGLLCRLGFM